MERIRHSMQKTHSLTRFFGAVITLLALAGVVWADDPRVPVRRTNDNRGGNANDQLPASVLVFNLFTSSATGGGQAQKNTKLTITNTNREAQAIIHLFVIDGATCATADAYLCLTPNQTASFLASDIDPGTTGYLIMVATDSVTGCPINFNYLVGSEMVKLASGHAAKLNAVGFSALYRNTLPGCNRDTSMATLNFDGRDYEAAPRRLALDNIPSPADGNSTLLIVNSLNGNLATGITKLNQVFGVLYDDAENAFSFASPAACQLLRPLADDFPRTSPLFSQVVPTTRSGWLFVMATRDLGLTGAAINFNAQAATAVNAFNGGSNLHHLEMTSSTLVMPVFPPSC